MMTVRDNGCGMDRQTLDNLFEPFFTTKAAWEGGGLGLATIYGMVRQNNGFVDVQSAPGQGTVFRIYLPRHRDATLETPDSAVPRVSPDGQATILLVEDEKAILKMTTRMLERLGYTVIPASSPGEAITRAALHEGSIHLLMTDVVMPEMSGRALAGRLLRDAPGLKCLFMSGYSHDVLTREGEMGPEAQLISKPFSKHELTVKLREVLSA